LRSGRLSCSTHDAMPITKMKSMTQICNLILPTDICALLFWPLKFQPIYRCSTAPITISMSTITINWHCKLHLWHVAVTFRSWCLVQSGS
jgi:hypothetical protein